MDDSSDDDRRVHSRQPIELKVEYKRLNTFFSDYTQNISKGGTFIRTSKPLDIGTEFVFKLFVPKLAEPLQIHGQVQWTVSEEDAEASGVEPGMGIRFVYTENEERATIERSVEKLMVDSLGQLLYSKLMQHARDRDDAEESDDDPSAGDGD